MANPGRPMIYANAIGSLDFSSGAFLAATPEVALQAAALVAMGKPTMYSKARRKVKEILANPVADPLPDTVMKELDEILLAADRGIEGH